MRKFFVVPLVLTLAGCGSADESVGASATATDTDTDGRADSTGSTSGTATGGTTSASSIDSQPWDMETETNPPTPQTDPGPVTLTSGTSEGGTEGEGEGETEGGETEGEEIEEDFVGLIAWGTAMPGVSYEDVLGEAVVFLNREEQCLALWSAVATPDDTCVECVLAYQLTITFDELEIDADCASYGFDEIGLDGMTLGIGGGEDEELYVNQGEGWVLVENGSAEYLEREAGFFEWVYPQPARE